MIYLKCIDSILGLWTFWVLWYAMTGHNGSVSGGITFFFMLTFIALLVIDVWNNLLIWTLAKIIGDWKEGWRSSNSSQDNRLTEGSNNGGGGGGGGNERVLRQTRRDALNAGDVDEGLMLLANGMLHDPMQDDDDDEEEDEMESMIGIAENGTSHFTSIANAAAVSSSSSSSVTFDAVRNGSSSKVGVGFQSGSGSAVPKLNFNLLGKGRQNTPRDSTINNLIKTQIPSVHSVQENQNQEDQQEGSLYDTTYETALATARAEVIVTKKKKAQQKREAVTAATHIESTEFEQLWNALPVASSISMDLYVLPRPNAILRFVHDRHFHVVASGFPTRSTMRIFICAHVERNSGAKGGCLFLGELVLDMSERRLIGTYKIERRKYLSTFLTVLGLHQLDESLSSGS